VWERRRVTGYVNQPDSGRGFKRKFRTGKAIHPLETQLAGAIWEFCSIPRTQTKIAVQFRQYEPREIKQTIRLLVRRGQLKEIFKGDRVAYVRL
jgi:hypothetical protein